MGGNQRAFANRQGLRDACLAVHHHVIFHDGFTADTHLGSQQAVFADDHPVSDVHLTIQFAAFPDDGIPAYALVDGTSSADIYLIFDDYPAARAPLLVRPVGHFFKIKGIRANQGARTDRYMVANNRIFAEVHIGLDITMRADGHVVRNDDTRLKNGRRMNLSGMVYGYRERFKRAMFPHQRIVHFKGVCYH